MSDVHTAIWEAIMEGTAHCGWTLKARSRLVRSTQSAVDHALNTPQPAIELEAEPAQPAPECECCGLSPCAHVPVHKRAKVRRLSEPKPQASAANEKHEWWIDVNEWLDDAERCQGGMAFTRAWLDEMEMSTKGMIHVVPASALDDMRTEMIEWRYEAEVRSDAFVQMRLERDAAIADLAKAERWRLALERIKHERQCGHAVTIDRILTEALKPDGGEG